MGLNTAFSTAKRIRGLWILSLGCFRFSHAQRKKRRGERFSSPPLSRSQAPREKIPYRTFLGRAKDITTSASSTCSSSRAAHGEVGKNKHESNAQRRELIRLDPFYYGAPICCGIETFVGNL